MWLHLLEINSTSVHKYICFVSFEMYPIFNRCKHFKYNLELYHCFVNKELCLLPVKSIVWWGENNSIEYHSTAFMFPFLSTVLSKITWRTLNCGHGYFFVEPILNSRWVPSESTLIVKSQNWLGVIHQVYLLNLKTITDHKMNRGVHRILGSQHWL